MPGRIRIAVIDDHPLFRAGLVSSLRRFSDIEIVSVGATADEALQAAQSNLVDILLLDIGIPGNGLAAARRIAVENATVRILILTGSNSEEDAAEALAIGALGYVLKGATGRELANAIRTVSEGQPIISQSIASRMLTKRDRPQTSKLPSQAKPGLTNREKQILDLAAQGLRNNEIAKTLDLSISGVKYHIAQIVRKWGVRTRVEAIVIHTQSKDGVSTPADVRRAKQG